MTPFFSVIIPVYNRADVLPTALKSVLAQTSEEFEIIVVDDGSTDGPNAVVDAIGDPRIRFLRQENCGGAAARNTGIDAAQGRFVAFLDSDDEFLPCHLEWMKDLLSNSSNTVGYARIIVDRGNGVTFIKPPRAIRPGEHMATYLLCDRGFVPTITVVVEREIAKRVRYGEGWRVAEDTDFAIRLYLAGCKFAMIEEPSAVWNDHCDPNRTSSGRKGGRLIPWLDRMKDRIPAKAYYGGRGWAVAKGVAINEPFLALRYYLGAVIRGCYRPSLAVIIFLQIFLSNAFYRRIADGAIPWLGGHKPARSDTQDAVANPQRTC